MPLSCASVLNDEPQPAPSPQRRVGVRCTSCPGGLEGEQEAPFGPLGYSQEGISKGMAVFNFTFLYQFWHKGILEEI